MSGRFVRASKYRHVHGDAAKKTECWQYNRINASGDNPCIAANEKFFAIAVQGGGGPVMVVNHAEKQKYRLQGAPTMNVHKAKTIDFQFYPFAANIIGTASEDCTAKLTVLPADGLTENINEASSSLEGHQKKLSCLAFNPAASNILVTGSYDHTVKLWDAQAQAEINTLQHGDTVTSLNWNFNGSLLATSCKDKKLRVYDPRAPDAAQVTDGLAGVKAQRSLWLDNFGRVAVVGHGKGAVRQYALYDPKMFDKPMVLEDIDNQSGVLLAHYDPDCSILYVGGKGDSGIKYFEIVDKAPYVHFLSEFRESSSQKGFAFIPKYACDVTSCEIARCMRLQRDLIQPVSFVVPRKSDIFQADIYPDTYAGKPALENKEWLDGTNKDPEKTSMKPGQRTEKAAVEFKADKSPAELKAELKAANDRIAELEAEVAKLKAGS